MSGTQSRGPSEVPPRMSRARIAWMDSDANLVMAQKTRRAVRDEVISTQERRIRQRRSLGLAIIGFVFLLVLLGACHLDRYGRSSGRRTSLRFAHPAGSFRPDAFLAMLAALIAVWKGQRDVEHDRGGFETSVR